MRNVKIQSNDSYVKDFLHTLNNFCSKCPLDLNVIYVPQNNTVYVKYEKKQIKIDIDITKNKKDVICSLKENLMKDYPVILKKEDCIPTSEEVEELMNKGLSLKKALLPKKKIVDSYLVIRKHDKYNELDCINLDNDENCKFKCKIPLSVVLKKIKNGEDVMENLRFVHVMEKSNG